MTERENALRIINRTGDPEWVPWVFDCYDVIVPSDCIRERPPFSEGNGYDWHGCYWVFDPLTLGYTPVPGREPVKDITKWREQVKFPDLDVIDWAPAKAAADNLDRENKLSYMLWESGPWERLHALIGFENALVSLYTEPEAVLELMEAITQFKLRVVEKIAEYYKPDIVAVFDDLGHQNAAFMSNDMFKKFIQPFDKRVGDALTAKGIIYCHHSCGKIDPLMGDIIDMGPKMILGLFAPYNDAEMVAEKYSDRIVIDGGLNNQMIWDDRATDEQLIADVRRCIDTHAPHKNLIVNTGIMTDPHRIELIGNEVRTYGKDYWKRMA